MIDSIHSLTHENLLLGVGVLLRGTEAGTLINAADPEAALAALMQDETRLVGATRDGCELRCVPHVVDLTRGCRTPAAGELLTAGWTVTLSGTLLEATDANLRMLLQTAEAAGDGLLWIGELGSGLLLIGLPCPIPTPGMTLRTSRSEPGGIAFALTMLHDAPGTAGLPLHLHWLKEGTHD